MKKEKIYTLDEVMTLTDQYIKEQSEILKHNLHQKNNKSSLMQKKILTGVKPTGEQMTL